MTMTFHILKVPIELGGRAKDGRHAVRNLGIEKSARTVHIGKNMSRCKSDLYIDSIEEMVSIAMYHLRISNFTEPPVL